MPEPAAGRCMSGVVEWYGTPCRIRPAEQAAKFFSLQIPLGEWYHGRHFHAVVVFTRPRLSQDAEMRVWTDSPT